MHGGKRFSLSSNNIIKTPLNHFHKQILIPITKQSVPVSPNLSGTSSELRVIKISVMDIKRHIVNEMREFGKEILSSLGKVGKEGLIQSDAGYEFLE